MCVKFEKELDEMEQNLNQKIEKLKSPAQIDQSLFERIRKIKHFQGYKNHNLKMGEKLVIYGLLDREEGEDMKFIKEAIKERLSKQIQEKFKGGYMKLLLDKAKAH